MLRSAVAVISGIVTLTLALFAMELVVNGSLMALLPGRFPDGTALRASLPLSIFKSLYTPIGIAVGGYVTVRVASRRPFLHALVMGTIQLVFNAGAMVAVFEAAPLWSWVSGLSLTVPAACLGASWHRSRPATGDRRSGRLAMKAQPF